MFEATDSCRVMVDMMLLFSFGVRSSGEAISGVISTYADSIALDPG